ncbi:fructosamine kinase family protein [Glycomyces buryatensis]|uniref:Aminoglycoside phosphotransferase n=1 Tax=Glycomyces buryatensis TaxID=2570927 RepID=A0A4S8QLH6_9ACTN|nr:fructosamine kinase family protein [Glycomyces buryatensis]THV41584.1 aminoglycoside phosphotransferase [Glycomyces buryatensis]
MDTASGTGRLHLLPELIEHQRVRTTPVKTEASASAQRLTFDDGTSLFAKFAENERPSYLAAEANGLRWLREATDSVVDVLYADDRLLVEPWIEPAEPNAAHAAELGRQIALMHGAGAERFGAPWRGYIGETFMDNDPAGATWAEWYAAKRIEPYLRPSRDNGALDAADVAAVEALTARLSTLAGSDETPARTHGDLWWGNVHWGTERAWMIDPAAHGGHRETDLANLRLWGGVPHFDAILAGYTEVSPLADGWEERVGLHQLFPLLIHTTLFGRTYRAQLMGIVSHFTKVSY